MAKPFKKHSLKKKLAQLPAVEMQHAPAKLPSKLHIFYSSTFPFNSKLFNCPLIFWLAVHLTPESESLKKISISILKIVPHAAGVEGLFYLMNAMKTKAQNLISPKTLKMMAQIKLHLLQGDPLLGPRKSRKESTYLR
ncbi:hypothetical protein VP01_2857g5 [Puccinia sorghi]|uniref:Uncharacterized protein n=1 Tax=Puccinia sorghi TaxID=27349 RepID=A0A0L6V2Q8_9BASI|nr:hypothetical protein VP01_2857g5 [Puccinia sorghi]